ncbi:MobC family plasmid mobilization relaxosome protein [Leucobacter sp. USCH14]|uniref:MobC family plasmid mobilization relaxosome protein n=1 Tax=Leucobacter sp. USCH14 TaxID=3024838 RepID=UPI00309FCC82
MARSLHTVGVFPPLPRISTVISVSVEAERKQAIAELFAIRREVGSIANNVNQLAKYANTESRFPKEAEALVAEFRALYPKLSAAVDRLAEP